LGVFNFSLLAVTLTGPPELDEGCHEFAFVTLGANKSQTDGEIIVDATLDNDPLFNVFKIEIYGEPFDKI